MDNQALLRQIADLKKLAKDEEIDISRELEGIEGKLEDRLADTGADTSPWHRVQLSRHPDRPGTLDYIKLIADEYLELHGDRNFGDDKALVGGLAVIDGLAVTFVGHQKGHNLRENIRRNGGMAHPEGYRKALRLAKQAEKFHRPLITFIDTGGAYPGVTAEERGIGEAIARNLMEFSRLKTVVLCFIIGEGGSGGALGIGVGDKIFMLENSVYSVISPEGYASILLRDPDKAEKVASLMKITAQDLKSFKIINKILPEPPGGAHRDPAFSAAVIKKQILESLSQLGKHDAEQLVRYRSAKIQKIGQFHDPLLSP